MKFYTRQRRTPTVIIVSLIDIFAILLIFVIVTTTFRTAEPEVTIKLPESKSAVALEKSERPTILSITEDEQIFLADKKVGLADLPFSIRELRGDSDKLSLAMKADKKVSYGFLMQVLDALKEAGVKGNLSAFTESKK